jgi:uncharacterized membrane protein YphA (DoxX/SURF4 family)
MKSPSPSNAFQHAALLILRLVLAAVFAYAGYAKIPFWSAPPEGISPFMATLVKILTVAEPLGALALALGFLVRWASLGLAAILAGAICIMQFQYGIGFSTETGPGWNFPLALLAGCFVLMAFGPGRWSVAGNRK